MASIKACWKQKKVLNKAYIRIWASGEQWGWWPCKRQPKRERERRQPACLCVSICTCIRLYLQRDPSNDVKRINDVAKRLAHLPSMGIPHHRMQIHLWKIIMRTSSCLVNNVTVTPCYAILWLFFFGSYDWTYLFEGQLAGQFEAHHHHASHPEEQDVMACLQQGAGVEHIQVLCLKDERKHQHLWWQYRNPLRSAV